MTKRESILHACKAAGTRQDTVAFTRLAAAPGVSYAAKIKAYREGVRFSQWVAERDAKAAR